MTAALASGLLLGLACGIAPGPLLALVIAQSIRHGSREGCKVALAPLVTDAPIIAAALAVSAGAGSHPTVLGILSLAGGAFVLYLAFEAFRPSIPGDAAAPDRPPGSWWKGILTNLLSPHPWLFWLTAGAAALSRGWAESAWAPVAFLAGFYATLVGSKLFLALAAGRARRLLAGRAYRVTLALLGATLAVFAALLLADGVRRLRAS